ncbi:MAG: glycosyltransferase family 2 protein [Thermomicrobiales bacterium]|nr:glycosyltransferase family 2 protein [Thermomicrobiales bacterium]
MAYVEILERRLTRTPRRIVQALSIDSPSAGSRHHAKSVDFKGWVLGAAIPVTAVEITGPGGLARQIPLGYWRGDVAEGHPLIQGAERCGFRGQVDLAEIGPVFELFMSAVLADGSRMLIARFTGRTTIGRPQIDMAPPPLSNPPSVETLRPPDVRPVVSIVIPVHNQSSLTRNCLDTLLTPGNITAPHEIIVVDDGSTDDTAEMLTRYGARVRAPQISPNVGFSGACNTGASLATGDFIMFLNNDTLPQPGWLDALVTYANQHPAAAIVGSKLLYPDGSVQHAGVAFTQDGYPHHLYAGFPADHPAVNVSRAFKAVTGACMLVRTPIFRAANGFDRVFVNGWEDVDLCLRLVAQGHEIHYCRESVVYHLESASRDSESPREIQNRTAWADRWRGRVIPDVLDYWTADGLLQLDVVGPLYPAQLRYAPEAAVVEPIGNAPGALPRVARDRLRARERPRAGSRAGRRIRPRTAGAPILDKGAPALSG